MQIKVFKLSENAKITKPRPGDAGYELYALNDVVLPAVDDMGGGTVVKINTGISLQIPENHVGLILDKSSIGIKGIKTFAGVIDSIYRGEIIVALENTTSSPIVFHAGDKVAQMLIMPYSAPDITFVDDAADLGDTERGSGGFGSTGAR